MRNANLLCNLKGKFDHCGEIKTIYGDWQTNEGIRRPEQRNGRDQI